MGILLRQLLSGVVLLGVGGMLSSTGLKSELANKKAPRVLLGYCAMVAGTVATVSALAGVLYGAVTS